VATSAGDLTLYRYKCTNQGYTEDLGDGVSLTLMLIPSGEFMMGASEEEPESNDDERPCHLVRVSKFFMGQHPVTQAQYERVMETNPATRYEAKLVAPDMPVVGVSWEDATAFCHRLSEQTQKHYRLPSEAEWEYACRAETETAYHFGPQLTSELANYRGEVGQMTTVQNYPPNRWGLYDMHGNVWEWCQDSWHDSYEGAPEDGSARVKDGSDLRVLRGGSWHNIPTHCRSAYRVNYDAVNRYGNFGFRVVCAAPRA